MFTKNDMCSVIKNPNNAGKKKVYFNYTKFHHLEIIIIYIRWNNIMEIFLCVYTERLAI